MFYKFLVSLVGKFTHFILIIQIIWHFSFFDSLISHTRKQADEELKKH